MIEKTKRIAGLGYTLKNISDRNITIHFRSGHYKGLSKTLYPSGSVDIDKGVRYFCEYA